MVVVVFCGSMHTKHVIVDVVVVFSILCYIVSESLPFVRTLHVIALYALMDHFESSLVGELLFILSWNTAIRQPFTRPQACVDPRGILCINEALSNDSQSHLNKIIYRHGG